MTIAMAQIKLLSADAKTPSPGSAHAAGYDISSTEEVFLQPGEVRAVGTGVSLAIQLGRVGMVCSRSGLALRHGVCVLNAPGIIDADYRGEIKVILINLGKANFHIKVGDRIAQLVSTPYDNIYFAHVDELPPTERGEGGFGSTGK